MSGPHGSEALASASASLARSELDKIRFDLGKVVFAGFALLLCLLVGLPLAWLAYYALTDKSGAFTLANFAQLFTDPTLLGPLQVSFTVATSVGLLSAVLAAPLAWLVARSDMPGRRAVRALMTASFVTPPFLGAIAWEVLAAPNSGLINNWYRALNDLPPFVHLVDIYSIAGLIFVDTCYAVPFVFVLVANALDRVPGDMEDAAASLGARPWRTVWTITLPLALPAILAGAVIAFLRSLTLFGTPAILALPAGFHTITTKIWSLFQYPPNPGLAAAAALPLLIITAVLLKAQSWILGRRGYAVVGGRNSQPRLVMLGRWRWAALALCMAALCFPVVLPYCALLKAAVSTTLSEPFSLENLTWKHVRFVFLEFSPTRLAIKNTLILGFLSATLGAVLALVVSYLATRKLLWGHSVLGFLATGPIAIPGIVLGVGLFLAYTRGPVVLYGTMWILLLAYVTIELPAAYQQLQSAFSGIHPELEEAGRILGAGRLRTLKDITAPLLRTGVIAAWCFIFIGVMRELSAAIMLFTAETKVIPVVIYDLNESGDLGSISVLGLTLLVFTFGVMLLANRVPGFGAPTSRT
ncbi:MAG: iron(III) transport system permease protein [Acidobacteriota bacterium]|nr:iron(III) transport system permease protein [Acidobacteriota bacterium]